MIFPQKMNPILAKQFYIDRIVGQAKKENIVIPDTFGWLLTYTINDPVTEETNRHLKKVDEEYGDESKIIARGGYGKIESKIYTLLFNAYEDDIRRNKEYIKKYRDAWHALYLDKHSGHFITGIIWKSKLWVKFSMFDRLYYSLADFLSK